jgi:hypothetical protein
VWRTPPPAEVVGRTIAVVDDMAVPARPWRWSPDGCASWAGRASSRQRASHTWAAPAPDVSALVTDAFGIFPWDRRVLADGVWQPHPETVAGLAAQGIIWPADTQP